MKKLLLCTLVSLMATSYSMNTIENFTKNCSRSFSATFQDLELLGGSLFALGYHTFNADLKNTQLKHALMAGYAGTLISNLFFKDSTAKSDAARKINKLFDTGLKTAMPITWLIYECKKSNNITLPVVSVGGYVGIKFLDVLLNK